MEKTKLERFIGKYNLDGACESVKYESDGAAIKVKAMSDDKNVISVISSTDMKFPQGVFCVYETKRLKSLLGVLGENLKVVLNKTTTKTTGVTMSDDSTKVTFVLADETVIPKVPDVKKLPVMEVSIKIDDKFINTFVKAKGALAEVGTFTIISDGKGTAAQVVIGHSTLNTNRVTIETETNKNGKLEAISFSADYFRSVLLANKEHKTGTLEISSHGLAVAKFSGDGFSSEYYLVQIDAED